MATGRSTSDEIYTKDKLLQQIDTCMQKTYSALGNGFSRSKEKPQGEAFHQLNFFQLLWAELTGIQQFDNMTELNTYYQNIKDFLAEKFADYYYCNNKPAKKMPDELQDLYAAIISFCQIVMTQKFYLAKITDENFLPQLEEVKNKCEKIITQSSYLNIEKLESELNEFDAALKLITNKINFSGYGQITTSETNSLQNVNQKNLEFLNFQLARLPKTSYINSIIKRLYLAVNQSDKLNTRKAQAELKHQIELIDIVKKETIKFLNSKINSTAQDEIELNRYHDELNSVLANISATNEKLQAIRASFLEIIGYKDNISSHPGFREIDLKAQRLVTACQMQKKYETNLFGSKNHWGPVCKQIEKSMYELHIAFSEFNGVNQKHLIKIEALGKRIESHQENYIRINSALSKMQLLKQKAIFVRDEFERILVSAKNDLLEHINNGIDYLKSFFKRHGGKVAFGSACGASLGLTVAIFTSLNPPGIALIMTASTMIGGSLSGGVGLASDVIKDKRKKQSTTTPEKNPTPPVISREVATPRFREVNQIWNKIPVTATIDTEIENLTKNIQPTSRVLS